MSNELKEGAIVHTKDRLNHPSCRLWRKNGILREFVEGVRTIGFWKSEQGTCNSLVIKGRSWLTTTYSDIKSLYAITIW